MCASTSREMPRQQGNGALSACWWSLESAYSAAVVATVIDMSETRRRWVDSGGLRLAMREEGAPGGPTILLVHGYPDNSGIWDGVAGRLADRFRVVRYDLRGFGESDAPAGRAGYRIGHLVDDLVAVVRATAADAPVHLVAHDWGSMLSWAAVGDPRHAGLFASFTSIAGPGLDHVPDWVRSARHSLARLRSVLRQVLHVWYIGVFQVPVLPELVWRIPALRARFHATYRDARNGLGMYRANMLGGRRRVVPNRTKVPIQQLVLTQDQYCLPALLPAADPWCERLWRRELVAGHWAIRTHPAEVARFVTEFVDHVGGRPASPALAKAEVALMRM
jgi:pimeloyl-ACP methyl ester carboxylesterase